ncbi:MAG TPA: TonB-dependent receptor [Ignavibacteriales bacterium]|nr:TonB-dependent receptor [Ignavibacteriales bacterium]
MKKTIVHWLFAILLFNSALQAGTTGKISGRLKDADTGEPLIGATILVTGTALGAVSDAEGYYSIINVLPGTWEVKASFIGYNTVIQKNISVSADRTTRLDFNMKSSLVSTNTVEVIAQKDVIIHDLTSSQSVVGSDQIKTLPVENIGDILSLQAGITTDAGGGMHMRGGRSSEIKYYIDGMAVSNPFSGGLAVDVQNDNVQELQVISGTFNAEYGQAMSGIVNIMTKEGGDKTSATFSAYAGDFLTSHSDMFLNINKINPLSQKYVEGSLSGPVPLLSNKVHYFLSGRYRNEEGYLYGQRIHTPGDTVYFQGQDASKYMEQSSGDSAMVPLSPAMAASFQAKITYNPVTNVKLNYLVIGDNSEYKPYSGTSHANMFNPDYLRTDYLKSLNNLFTITHTINQNFFHQLQLSYYTTRLKIYASENPFDSIFVAGIQPSRTMPNNIFNVGGIDPNFLYRKNDTKAIKYEITGQVDRYNLFKAGIEYRQYQLENENFAVRRDANTNWQLKIDDVTAASHNYYFRKPIEMAAFLQDKIEVEDFIVNVGLRFDYYNSKSKVPVNMTDPHNNLGVDQSVAYRDATAKTQLSPRLGLAFPISDKGNLHVSYGQFFQIPESDRLYENPEFEVEGARFSSFIGNADLEAQRTTVFEIGLQQQVASNLVLNANCYYKDYRGLSGTQFFETYYALEYGQYANADFGNVWGTTISLDLLKTGMLSAAIDYTFQVADGNGSDPKEAFRTAGTEMNKNLTTKSLIPLNWDQRHVLNATVTIQGEDWGITSLNKFSSGYPYNPLTDYFPVTNIQLQNQGRFKPEYSMDLRVYKNFTLAGVATSLFLSVQNVFDYTRVERLPQIPIRDLLVHQKYARFNSLYDYRMDPGQQPAPRLVKLGFRVEI